MQEEPLRVRMKPAHPGEILREDVLAPLDLSVTQAAEILGVRRATLSDLLNGHAALSPEMALRVEKAFGIKMETLLRIQAWHDAYTMREQEDEIAVAPYPIPDHLRRDPAER
ncbi:MAG: HigA family addiction module antitoxin [Hyphomicrobiales bacterium]|nr:HigA family addiction module antitoxin [Hyphomicrobiales bacterium]